MNKRKTSRPLAPGAISKGMRAGRLPHRDRKFIATQFGNQFAIRRGEWPLQPPTSPDPGALLKPS